MVDDFYDYLIIGSGFGGSVSALRLVEKGYRVLLLEKGRRFQPEDFPKSNWQLNKWLWLPSLAWRGCFRMSFFRNFTVFSGVGVGGGSLVYANTLPVPEKSFFQSQPWGNLADWQAELKPHYDTAQKMLGVTENKFLGQGDLVLKDIAATRGQQDKFRPSRVGVFMGGDAKHEVPDPYFDGQGPPRRACNYCGACMTGCRHGAKNTLDKNYLYLAEKLGLELLPETEVVSVAPVDGGYRIQTKTYQKFQKPQKRREFYARKVIFSAGVLGSLNLLLKLKQSTLPKLSNCLGQGVRTNKESLLGVISPEANTDFSKGLAINSIFHSSEDSHFELVRYAKGSGFFRLLLAPHAPGESLGTRFVACLRSFFKQPKRWLKALFVPDFAKHSQIILYMRTCDESFALKRSGFLGRMLGQELSSSGSKEGAFQAEASALASEFSERVKGVSATLSPETLFNTPSTAHILGGCCMGKDADSGVINTRHEVFAYPGLYVIDGSAVSANPGVNPSLTITALAERALSFIPAKS